MARFYSKILEGDPGETGKENSYIRITYRARSAGGDTVWLHNIIRIIPDPEGRTVRLRGSMVDVTEHKQAEERIARLGRILDNSSNEIYVFDVDTLHFTQVNQGARRNLGYILEELKTLTPLDLKPQFTRRSFEDLIAPLRRGERDTVTFETVHKRKDGGLYPVEARLHISRTETPPVIVAIIQDITERKQAEERLNYLAYYDTLTALPNRVLLLDRLGQAVTRAARHRRVVAVLFLDLDRFKVVNDSFGHSMGDQLLTAVAQRLCNCMRAGDTAARFGGDEFAFILEDMAHAQDIAPIAQKILDQFTQPFRAEDPVAGTQEFYFTASIGISLCPDDGEDAHILLGNADAAMYRAKGQGVNRYHFFTSELNARAQRRLNLESALHRALEQEQFVLHYQPQVNRQTGKITAVEALLRWNHPEQGLIPSMEFIPVLEETGLIVPVGEWVLRTACRQQRAWRDAAGLSPLRVAVNLSMRQLRDGRFVDSVVRILVDTGVEPAYLELEITESMVMQQIKEVIETLYVFRAVGVGLAMDDFGTGYSSLSYLKRLPLDTLKIDKSFVGDITTDPDDVAIVAATIAMAHSLRLKVVAEGVETQEQFDFLCEHGCDAMQGYFFSKPLPAEEIPRLLRNDKV